MDKHTRGLLKIIDNLKRRRRAYKLYEVAPALWTDDLSKWKLWIKYEGWEIMNIELNIDKFMEVIKYSKLTNRFII